MDLKSYTLEELETYLHPFYSKPGSTVPLSPLRLNSYLKNPRARKNDPVLFEMHQNGELLAYRTLLPDCFFDKEGLPHRFAWLSGNWVRPDMRRKGYSSTLLELAEEQWQGQLMYTNYAPASKALYDKSGKFETLVKREGKRFYLRAANEELLGKRLGSQGLLRYTDTVINRLRENHLQKSRLPKQESYAVDQVEKPEGELGDMVDKMQASSLFRRDATLINWALSYPWVSTSEETALNYPFSFRAERFENLLLRFRHEESGERGMAWFILHNNVLSVPYIFSESERLLSCMAETLVRTLIDRDCTHLTLRNPKLIAHMAPYQKVFLAIRKMPQLIFIHKRLKNLLPEQSLIHDGDGDVMFTG